MPRTISQKISKIILVLTNNKGAGLLFILDDFQAYSLKEIVFAVKRGEIYGVHLVKTKYGTYVRTNPNTKKEDNLDSISAPLSTITKTGEKNLSAATTTYRQKRSRYLHEKTEKILYIDGQPKRTEGEAVKYLLKYKAEIISAASELKADKYLIGAILIDEELRGDWIDNWSDWLAKLEMDRSVGIAQVKTSTARDLIARGFYPADYSDKDISPQKISKASNRHIYNYINTPQHSIRFVAAKINQIKHDFAYRYAVSSPEVVADLYSRGNLEKTNGRVTKRGKQIANEFYEIARKALR